MTATSYLGKPTSRIDGRAKVTGTAKYAAEYNVPGLAHGVVVSSAIAKGRIRRIDAAERSRSRACSTCSRMSIARACLVGQAYSDEVAPPGSPFRPLYDDRILFSGQPVALVVAEDFEIARFAASLVRVEYEREAHVTDFFRSATQAAAEVSDIRSTRARRKAAEAFDQAAVQVEAEYRMPVEHHNPMETFAATAVWEGDGSHRLRQDAGTAELPELRASVFGMPPEEVRVLSPYVGGAFGSGLRPQYQLPLAVLAARALKRSVRVDLTRAADVHPRLSAEDVQELALGADTNGNLASFRTSSSDDLAVRGFPADAGNWSSLLYRCANTTVQRLVKLDQNTPVDMRAPGGAEGAYAIECAMDELAYAAKSIPWSCG